jgi:hypothetical protein
VKINSWFAVLFLTGVDLQCGADAFIVAPTPGAVGGPTDTASFLPFLIKQITVSPFSSMRYQQVYDASVFTNVDPNLIYITTLTFFLDDFGKGAFPWTVTNMQINLSTTPRLADNLSTNFAENVGADDMIVFGPSRHDFPLSSLHERLPILLDRPFRYNPALGDLLLDVRVFNGSGLIDMNNPELNAYNSPMDESSRVWATNVADAVASGSDTTGLDTVIQFSAIPSLVIYTTGTNNTPTNYVVIDWPSQPSVFRLQHSEKLGTDAIWQTVTNATAPRYFFPVESAGAAAFYRLVWEEGQPVEVQPGTVPKMRGTTQELPLIK